MTMANHHEQKCQDPLIENTSGVSSPEGDVTVKADAGLDPFKTESSKEGEISESLHGPVGSELQECLYANDKDDKSSVSKKDSETPATSVPRYFLDDRSIVIFSDVCSAVLKTWGSYKNLQNVLKKQGIATSQFDQSQLRMLKKIGAVDVRTKQCSFIAEGDFIKILHKYDEENNTDNAKYCQLSSPVDINNHCLATDVLGNQNGKGHSQESFSNTDVRTQNTIPSPFLIHVFSIGNHDFVTLSEISNMIESYFQRPHILNSVLQNLKVAIGTFTTNELAKIEIYAGTTSDDSLRKLYISKKDFERVLQYTSAFLDINPPNVNWVQLGKLNVNVARKGVDREGSVPVRLTSSSSSTATMAHIPENNVDVQGDTEACDAASSSRSIMTDAEKSSASETASTSHSGLTCVIRTCLVNGEIVVCIPDLHKTVIDLYGHCVQVGNYMHRLKISTHRFSTTCLKRLKAHNILSSKATVCTYITKADAERLLKMYHLGNQCGSGSGNFPGIEWSEPVILESAVNNASEGHPSQLESNMPTSQSNQAKLKIPLFTINNQVVVSVPDVHKAVQLMNGQSVQLRYNLDKLGITKLKYTYSEVHHLKVLGHLNRPSSCTYITKSDVDRLLCYYMTPENEARLKLIEWQQPVAVEKLVNITASDRQSSSPEMESVGTEILNNDENNADDQREEEDYSISDLYKVFVGDELETIPHSSNEGSDNQCEKILPLASPSSSASSSVYRFSPPSCHNFTTPITRIEENAISDQLKSSSTASSYMSALQQHDLTAVNQSAVNVTQMQVVVSNSSSDPVRSKVLSTSSQTCCDRNDPIVTNQMAVPSRICSQVVPLPPSSFFTVPGSSMVTVHTSSMPACASPLTAGSSVYSTCTATVARDGQSPNLGSTFTSSGKL